MLSATKLRRLAFCAFIALDIEDTKIFNSCKLLQDTEHMHCCMRHGGCWGFTTVPVTVGVGHSRRYCITGYDQSQGMRPSTLKCIGPISKGDIEPNHPSEINPNSDSRSSSDGRSRRFVQYRVDQSQDRDQDHFSRTVCDMSSQKLYKRSSALIRIFGCVFDCNPSELGVARTVFN